MTKTVSAEATEASATEASSTPDETTVGGIFEEVALGEGEGTTTESPPYSGEDVTLGEGESLGETTTEASSGQLETTTTGAEEEATTAATAGEDSAKEDESLNEIDTDGFVVSQDTLDSAKKYGYKILLKKVKLLSSEDGWEG